MKLTLSGLALFALASLLTPACSGVSGTVAIPLPDRLGGGILPITIHPSK